LLSVRAGSGALGLAIALCAASCDTGKPAPLTPDEVPAAFLAVTGKPDRTVHMEWSGSMSFANDSAQAFEASFDLAGNDYAGSVTTPGESFGKPGADTTIEFALVNGQGYERGAGETAWQMLPTNPSTVDPLHGLGASDVEYVGQEIHGGDETHHLRIRNFGPLVSGLLAGMFLGSNEGMGETFDVLGSEYDVWTDTAGLPLEASVEIKPGEVVFAGFSLSATYRFSNWNADIYIVPPQSLVEVDGVPQK
jgi:hypothetical protein